MSGAATGIDAAAGEGGLRAIERMAVELAGLAGAEIVNALGTIMAVKYKSGSADQNVWLDPVSDVDQRVETLIRARLGERYPAHDIIGEEMEERPGRDHDFVWAVDPIDGTANFVNGFPLFAASIGVLYRGRPVAGAVWCAVSHRLRAGVYHARAGGELCFENEAAVPKRNRAVRRGLAGVPDAGRAGESLDMPWETRKTGSAAIECALVAAGLMRVARFERPNIWDIAGGIALLLAAGREVRVRTADHWTTLERFDPVPDAQGATPDLRNWRHALVVGAPDAVALMCERTLA
jgi:myo-inositol-1(or 4)-monophosphatase